MLKNPLLPEWRYWPAVPLAALILIPMLWASFVPPQQIRGEQHPSQHTQSDIDPRSVEERTADYNLWLERFTGLLVMVGALQIYLLFRTDKTARESIEIAREQVDIAKLQQTIILQQTDIQTAQKEISRIQFFAEHRPKLEIRFIKKLRYADDRPPDQQPILVEFSVVNSGGSDAKFIGGKVSLDWLYPVDVPNPDDLSGTILDLRTTFIPSARDRYTASSPHDGGWAEVNGAFEIGKRLYLLGWIIYSDGRGIEFGTVRTTYFCFEHAPSGDRFVPSDFPDWNLIT